MSKQEFVDEIQEIKSLVDVSIETLQANNAHESSIHVLQLALKKLELLQRISQQQSTNAIAEE